MAPNDSTNPAGVALPNEMQPFAGLVVDSIFTVGGAHGY
jgi:hypothetical protein